MQCRLFYLFICISFAYGCTSNAQSPENRPEGKPTQRKSGDTAIYGGLPHLPDKSFPPSAKRKTADTPTALCNDENYTFSRNFDYACKGHGGVKKWTYDGDIQITPDNPNYYED